MTAPEDRPLDSDDGLSREESQRVRAGQQSRANMLAVVLMALAALFFAITVVKVGGWL